MYSLHTQPVVEALGGWEEADELPYISHQDIGYNYLQGDWLIRSGALLTHSGELGNTARVIRYDAGLRQFEFLFFYRDQQEEKLKLYKCRYADLFDVEWEQAMNLDRFDIGLPNLSWMQIIAELGDLDGTTEN